MERKDASFFKSAGLISALTLVSRLLGLFRESVWANFFGTTAIWGDFAIAFRIPNLARRLFGEGALTAAFIPVLAQRLETSGRQAAARTCGNVIVLLGAVLVGLVLLGELAIWLGLSLGPSLCLSLTAVMLPYMFLICMVALLAGAQHVLGRFGMPALMPILFNVILILGTLVGARWTGEDPRRHLFVLAGFVLLAGAVQLLLQWRALLSSGMRPPLVCDPTDPDVRRIARAMGPTTIGLAAVQLNSLADLLVAKFGVPDGSGAAVLSYGERLYQLPIGLFGAAIATAIFPKLSTLARDADPALFVATLRRGLRLAIFVGVPASIGLYLVSRPAVIVVFRRGAFTADSVERVAAAVRWYGLGVWAYVSQQVLIRGYYARKDSGTPMRIACGMLGLNLALNLLLVRWFRESGIAMATAGSAAVQVVLLSVRFQRTGVAMRWASLAGSTLTVLAAAVVMAVGLWATGGLLERLPGGPPSAGIQLIVLVATGIGLYGLVAWLLGCARDLRATPPG